MNDRPLNDPMDLETLSPKYDEYVDLALDLANDRLSPRQAAEFHERMKTDAMFRRVVQPVLDAHRHPARMSKDDLADRWEEFRRRAGLVHPDQSSLVDFEARVEERRAKVWRTYRRIAAVIAFLLVVPLSGWFYLEWAYWDTRVADPNVFSTVRLPDGSSVVLAPGSRVRYLKALADKRDRVVSLKGQGTFTVTPIASHTFEVRTPQARIIAIGTRFDVLAADAMTIVTVEEGKVTVQALDAEEHPTGRLRTVGAGTRVRLTTAGIIDDAQMTPNTPPGTKP